MTFCGQCGLLLNTNITKCPRCGTATEIDATAPGTPANDNAATIIAHMNNNQPGNAPYMPQPPSSDTAKAAYSTAPAESTPQSDRTSMTSGAPPYPSQAPEMYQPPMPPRKTRKWPVILMLVLIVVLIAVTIMFFALKSNPLARVFGLQNTPIVQETPIAAATPQLTPTMIPTQQAQATLQQYYSDINAHAYRHAYGLWVTNPDNYDHYVQGFAHTHHDDITLGDAILQTDGTVRVNITVQATEDAAGGGTTISTYQGYYTVGQQADGSWKIINGQLG